jgi:hypothetical protein
VRMRGTSESKVLKQRAIKVPSASERVQRVVELFTDFVAQSLSHCRQ